MQSHNTSDIYVIPQVVFELMDANKDGVIQLEEYQYAIIQHDFVSGPGSPYSQLFGFMEGQIQGFHTDDVAPTF